MAYLISYIYLYLLAYLISNSIGTIHYNIPSTERNFQSTNSEVQRRRFLYKNRKSIERQSGKSKPLAQRLSGKLA